VNTALYWLLVMYHVILIGRVTEGWGWRILAYVLFPLLLLAFRDTKRAQP
jgi:ABC-type uncharacterized transport system permease subunit